MSRRKQPWKHEVLRPAFTPRSLSLWAPTETEQRVRNRTQTGAQREPGGEDSPEQHPRFSLEKAGQERDKGGRTGSTPQSERGQGTGRGGAGRGGAGRGGAGRPSGSTRNGNCQLGCQPQAQAAVDFPVLQPNRSGPGPAPPPRTAVPSVRLSSRPVSPWPHLSLKVPSDPFPSAAPGSPKAAAA